MPRTRSEFHYLRIVPGEALPTPPAAAPFKAMVAADDPVPAEERARIAVWLVGSGCRYVVPYGSEGDAWRDAVRDATLAGVDPGSISAADVAMATSHPNEPLRAVMWFARRMAAHPEHRLDALLLVHVSTEERAAQFMALYEKA